MPKFDVSSLTCLVNISQVDAKVERTLSDFLLKLLNVAGRPAPELLSSLDVVQADPPAGGSASASAPLPSPAHGGNNVVRLTDAQGDSSSNCCARCLIPAVLRQLVQPKWMTSALSGKRLGDCP